MLIHGKKGMQTELSYLVFISVFLAILTMGTMLFFKDFFIITSIGNGDNILTGILAFIGNVILDVPVIGQLFSLILSTMANNGVNPYISEIVIALFGIPLGYVIVKVIRGGG